MGHTRGAWLLLGIAAVTLVACGKSSSAEDRAVGRAIDATLATPSLRFVEEAGADRAEVAIDRQPSPRMRARITQDGRVIDTYVDDKVVLASDDTHPGNFIGLGAPCPGRGERAVQFQLAATGLPLVAETAERFVRTGDGGYSSVLRTGGRVEVILDGGLVRSVRFVGGAAPTGAQRVTFEPVSPPSGAIERPSDDLVRFAAAGDEAATRAAAVRGLLDFATCPT